METGWLMNLSEVLGREISIYLSQPRTKRTTGVDERLDQRRTQAARCMLFVAIVLLARFDVPKRSYCLEKHIRLLYYPDNEPDSRQRAMLDSGRMQPISIERKGSNCRL